MTRGRALHELPDHGHGAEPRVHERLHGEHAGRAAAAPLRDLQPGPDGHRLPDQRAVLRRRQRAHAPAPAVALRLPQHERDLEHDHAPREQEPRAADGQHRDRVPLAAGRRRPSPRGPHGSTSTRSATGGTPSTRSRPATPTRTATGPSRRTRASSACPATCTTSTSSTRVRARCIARHAGRRSRSARSFWAATATTTSGRSRPTTRRPRTSRARRCAGRRRITGPRSGRRCGANGHMDTMGHVRDLRRGACRCAA